MDQELISASKIALFDCMNLKKNESLLIITDDPCKSIGYALWQVAKEHGVEAVLTEIIPRKSHGEEPPDQISILMKLFDVVLIPTSKSLSHTESRREASKSGVRIATLPGISEETMKRALNSDYQDIALKSDKIAEILSSGNEVRILTDKGTDIVLNIIGRKGLSDTGLNYKKGDFSNLPAGEAYIAPLEDKANGVIVFDGSMSGVGLLNDDLIEVKVVDGYAVEIKGGKSASKLNSIMEPHGKLAYNLAELGIGTNENALVVGNILEDEKALNTIHIAFGDNKSMGGNIRVPSHLDGVILSPTVIVDNNKIMEDGKLLI
ncbi:MAG: aminopeptidase [Candidatus Dadabacteria bacterium]|nr:aminopeptidase [Candidatus Dadabacteria bacterium]NIQ12852.1 aminopeptidase [Candidatus Dadabacteria bacterium]